MTDQNASDRPAKTLVIWDLDNTLTDTLDAWARSTYPVVQALSETLSIPQDDLVSAIHKAPGQFRFCDFGRCIDWLHDEGHLAQARKRLDKSSLSRLLETQKSHWYEDLARQTRPSDNVLHTLKTVKSRQTAQVIDTDTEAASLVRRLWLLSRAATADDLLENETALVDLFDQFYCQPSIEDDSAVMAGIPQEFVHAVKKRTTIWRGPDRYKPHPSHTSVILSDFKTPPEQAVYIGDSHKDGGSARVIGVDFLWNITGADTAPETVAIAKTIASPKYQYGLDSIRNEFNEASRPHHILKNGVQDCLTLFSFEAGNNLMPPPHTVSTGSGFDRNSGHHEEQNRLAYRLRPLFQSQERIAHAGPATHFQKDAPKTDLSNHGRKGGQERPDLRA